MIKTRIESGNRYFVIRLISTLDNKVVHKKYFTWLQENRYISNVGRYL